MAVPVISFTVVYFYARNQLIYNSPIELLYLDSSDFVKAGEEIQHTLDALPDLQPFSILPTDDERNRIAALFTKEHGDFLWDYLHRRAKVGLMDDADAAMDILPPEYDKGQFALAEKMIVDVTTTLHFYNSIGEDVTNAFNRLRKFVSRLDEAERFDEAHLFPIAVELFGQAPFPVDTEYVQIQKKQPTR